MMKILPMIPKWGIRGKLLASFLVSLGPLILLGYLLAWERDVLPYLILAGLLSLLLALVAIWWLTRPLSQLTCRALNMVEEFIPEVSAKGGDEIEQLAGVLESISTQLTRALAERRMLYSIGQNSTVYFDLDNILSEIAESAVELLGATSGVIGLWDKEKQVFRDATLVNLPQELLEREFPIEESLTTHVVERGHPIVLDDYSTYPRRLTLLDSYQFKGAIGVPLLVHGECIGSLVVLTTDPARRFSAQDVELLARFANQAAVAIQNIKLYSANLQRLRELAEAQEELSQRTDQLRQLLAKTVRLQEEERARIAADIHDQVIPLVVGALYETQAAMGCPSSSSELTELHRSQELLNQAVDEMRRVIFNLRPLVLESRGLVPALQKHIQEFQTLSGIASRVRVLGNPFRLPPEVEIAAYRIVQEALHNVRKHARATTVHLSIEYKPAEVQLVIQDNGKGFDWRKVLDDPGERVGLVGMRERAQSIGGRIQIDSRPGRGSRITLLIPVSHEGRRQA